MNAFNEEKLKGRGSNLAISSVCNSNCLFCSNHQNPFRIKRAGFISWEDFEKQLFYIQRYQNGNYLSLSDVLPGTISEGEALLHPQFREIIEEIRKSLDPNIEIAITTNGGLLTDDMIQFLSRRLPISVSVSIPSFDKSTWLKMFGSSNEDMYSNAISSFEKMIKSGIKTTASVVPLPAIAGWDDLEHTLVTLGELGIKPITIWYPGYTRYTPNEEFLNAVTSVSFNDLHSFFDSMKRKHGLLIKEIAPDANYSSIDYNNYEARINEIFWQAHQNGASNILWGTSEAAYEYIKQKIEHVSAKYGMFSNTIVPIENKSYGGNIKSTGLLMLSDIVDAMLPYQDQDLYVLPPPTFLNRIGEDLMGESVAKLKEFFGGKPYLFA